jgi:hypothetical protein
MTKPQSKFIVKYTYDEGRYSMATINLTEGTEIKKSPERIRLEKCREALMGFVPKNGNYSRNTDWVIRICNEIEKIEREI